MKTAAAALLGSCLLPVAMFAQAVAYDFSKLYEAVSPAVVQVTTDDASGSGFLVTPFGHIATNFHVIRSARYLAVQFPDGRKVKAAVVAANPQYDMAILKVNSEVVSDIEPLQVLPENREDTIKVGIPVVAIGSPLNQKFLMTQGILSKVDDTTVLGDFLLQSGNSGGPLMNTDGEVVGMNTFGEGNISGAIRIAALRVFLTSPELLAQSIGVEPSPEPLRSVSSMRYPVEVLNHKIEKETLDAEAYTFQAGDFTVTAITPVLIGKLHFMYERRQNANRPHRRGTVQDSNRRIEDPYYEWHRSTETSLDYAVTFDIRPESGPTKRNFVSRMVPPIFRFGKTEMEFKGEFLEFRIYRDGELVEPITPGRVAVAGSPHEDYRYVNQSHAGSYVYAPDDFMSGAEFRVQVIDARNPTEIHSEITFTQDSKLIKQLRGDFTFAQGVLISRKP